MRSSPTLTRTTCAHVSDKPFLRARPKVRKKDRTKGHAVMEAALVLPWLIFLFVGAFDMGFYCYDLISVENAARIAVEYTATSSFTASDTGTACTLALNELATVPNLASLSTCNSLPLKVSASAVSGKDGAPASQVSVQYQSALFIPIPGLLTGRLNITRVAQMRLKS
jgi:Flp pilus assembly protein TadG